MENFSNLVQRLEFFRKYKRGLKASEGDLCGTDVLNYCDRPLVCLNSKFDELKEFHLVRIEKKCTNSLLCLEFFLKCKIDLKESNA